MVAGCRGGWLMLIICPRALVVGQFLANRQGELLAVVVQLCIIFANSKAVDASPFVKKNCTSETVYSHWVSRVSCLPKRFGHLSIFSSRQSCSGGCYYCARHLHKFQAIRSVTFFSEVIGFVSGIPRASFHQAVWFLVVFATTRQGGNLGVVVRP